MLTETEAKTKYCPMTFMNPLKMTRLSKGNSGFRCAGSECMWWVCPKGVVNEIYYDGFTQGTCQQAVFKEPK